MRTYLALTVLLLLSGCGSAPTHFFTLATVPPGQGAHPGGCGTPKLSVRQVLLPGTLDRDSVVRMRNAEIVEISGDDRWAGPLGGMIQRVIAGDLRARLSSNQVLLPGDTPPSGGTTGLTVNIARFAGDAAGHVTLQADWTLTNPRGGVVREQTETIEVNAASPKTPDVVAAMSQALGQLADRVVNAIPPCG